MKPPPLKLGCEHEGKNSIIQIPLQWPTAYCRVFNNTSYFSAPYPQVRLSLTLLPRSNGLIATTTLLNSETAKEARPTPSSHVLLTTLSASTYDPKRNNSSAPTTRPTLTKESKPPWSVQPSTLLWRINDSLPFFFQRKRMRKLLAP